MYQTTLLFISTMNVHPWMPGTHARDVCAVGFWVRHAL